MQVPRKTKNRSKVAVISMVMTVGAIVLFLLPTILSQFYSYDDVMMFSGIGLLAASYVVFFFGGKSSKTPEGAKENIITVIGCRSCDYREERPFVAGDYIGKDLGPCKKCSGPSYIKAIYAVETKKQ